jgi:hypothetical protein
MYSYIHRTSEHNMQYKSDRDRKSHNGPSLAGSMWDQADKCLYRACAEYEGGPGYPSVFSSSIQLVIMFRRFVQLSPRIWF